MNLPRPDFCRLDRVASMTLWTDRVLRRIRCGHAAGCARVEPIEPRFVTRVDAICCGEVMHGRSQEASNFCVVPDGTPDKLEVGSKKSEVSSKCLSV